jgi:hypothetical protein
MPSVTQFIWQYAYEEILYVKKVIINERQRRLLSQGSPSFFCGEGRMPALLFFITEDDFITEDAFRKIGEVLTSKISQNLP